MWGLPKQARQVCLLYQPNQSLLVYNPKASFVSAGDLQGLQQFVQQHQGCLLIGYLSYDLIYQLYQVQPRLSDYLNLPKICFYAFQDWQYLPNQKILADKSLTKKTCLHLQSHWNFEQYQQAFQQVQEYLRLGEVYQLNLTHCLTGKTELTGQELFQQILTKNLMPGALYFEGADFEILSFSPEKFFQTQGQRVTTSPIKGTRPRQEKETADAAACLDLQQSVKEQAELTMITDLLRNDLNQVCAAGSVRVEQARFLQQCPGVWHTASQITGILATTPLEALLQMFPGGSVTGCPKRRALDLIEELEFGQRGIYTGVLGLIQPGGDFDFRIVIRTLVQKNERVYLQVGGGLVVDSVAKSEWAETWQKARPFLTATAN